MGRVSETRLARPINPASWRGCAGQIVRAGEGCGIWDNWLDRPICAL